MLRSAAQRSPFAAALFIVCCILWRWPPSYPNPDIWLGVDLVALAVLGIVVAVHAPVTLIEKAVYSSICIIFAVVGIKLIIQQSRDAETDRRKTIQETSEQVTKGFKPFNDYLVSRVEVLQTQINTGVKPIPQIANDVGAIKEQTLPRLPRHIPPGDEKALLVELSGYRSAIDIEVTQTGIAEQSDFATELYGLFKNSTSWSVNGVNTLLGVSARGVIMSLHSPIEGMVFASGPCIAAKNTLAREFDKLKYAFRFEITKADDTTCHLLIGSRE